MVEGVWGRSSGMGVWPGGFATGMRCCGGKIPLIWRWEWFGETVAGMRKPKGAYQTQSKIKLGDFLIILDTFSWKVQFSVHTTLLSNKP